MNLNLTEEARRGLLSHYFADDTRFSVNGDTYEVCLTEDEEGLTFIAVSTWDGLAWGIHEIPIDVWTAVDSGMSMAWLVMRTCEVLEEQARFCEMVGIVETLELKCPLTWEPKEVTARVNATYR